MKATIVALLPSNTSKKVIQIAHKLHRFSHPNDKPILYHVARKKKHLPRRVFRDHEVKSHFVPHVTITPGFEAHDPHQLESDIKQALSSQKPIKLKINQFGYHKNLKPFFTVNLQIKPNHSLTKLRAKLIRRFRKSTQVKIPDTYIPHITLIYDDKCGLPADMVKSIKNKKINLSFTIRKLVLVQKTRSGYKILKTFTF